MAILFAFALPELLSAEGGNALPAENAPLVVNGSAVTPEEFRWFMDQERVGVIQHFHTKCNLEYGKDYWNHLCDGTTPKAMLQKRTVDRTTREKIEQLLFQELGLIQDVSYAVFLENLETLNREREQAVKDGRVIYGPVRYTQLQFYGHWKATLQLQAKGKLTHERLAVTEQKVRAFYDQHKDIFKTADVTTLETVTIGPMKESNAEKIKGKVTSAAREILSKMRAGRGIEHLLQGYADRTDIRLSRRRFDSLDNERVGELFAGSENVRSILGLAPGQCVSVADSGGTIQVVKCISRTPGDYLPFETVKERVRARCLDQQYDELLSQMVKKACVRVNQEAVVLLLPP